MCHFLWGNEIFSAKEISLFYECTIHLLTIHANDIMPFYSFAAAVDASIPLHFYALEHTFPTKAILVFEIGAVLFRS